MAFVAPRSSGLWEDSSRMTYFQADDDDEELDLEQNDDFDDGRTALDKTIDRIGMGWMADNMWIQAVAIILPRVQQHYSVPDSYIGTLSSSMFAGMMFGAVGWGTCSDLMGRSTAFNATLFFTAVFGLAASFANTFGLLCVSLFFLGSSVGGSMPTDGTLLLEHMPRGKEYLVTALSIFFSFGAVVSALVALLLIPKHSCPPAPAPCDMGAENMGWKYTIMALGLITLTMFLARMVFFRLHESPRYLVHAGRHQEALESLQLISRFNGDDLDIGLHDVDDSLRKPSSESRPFLPSPTSDIGRQGERQQPLETDVETLGERGTPLFAADVEAPEMSSSQHLVDRANHSPLTTATKRTPSPSTPPENLRITVPAYSATTDSPTNLGSYAYRTPIETAHVSAPNVTTDRPSSYSNHNAASPFKESPTAIDAEPLPHARPRRGSSRRSRASRASTVSSMSMYDGKGTWLWWKLPRGIRRPLGAWLDRFAMVLAPEWLRTTLLVWGAWFGMSLAYTMFNVYLPKLLEARGAVGGKQKSLEGTLWDVVIFTVGGCPGAVFDSLQLGAYLIESPLGRRLSLAGSTFVTAFFCIVFVMVDGQFAVTASTIGISLSATAMWAVLYGWTPEIFGTKVRGTACGTASALSRMYVFLAIFPSFFLCCPDFAHSGVRRGGMIAPILGGVLLMGDTSFPVENPGDAKARGAVLVH
ncbi:hypothetical protein EW146_g3782 [Bondarzewia mesenterica]|uniref:Major facilitator superfamily (MFS) profile domain-containing protein n=1 Tax=Bondarzewia mesenterica TaxID=1095465 RepID=A0A4S4LWK7_9AGAM|nr:hypothetical protein EW146_g3782 [Bondarzewia mesenterica]